MWSLLLFKVGCSALVLAVSIVRTAHAFLLLSSEGGSTFSTLRSHIIYVSPHVVLFVGAVSSPGMRENTGCFVVNSLPEGLSISVPS